MSPFNPRRSALLLILVATTLVLPGCSDEFGGSVGARGVTFDMSTQALRFDELYAAHGFYTNCAGRPDDGTWSIAITPGAVIESPLTVWLNNHDCQLTLTHLEIVRDDNEGDEDHATWDIELLEAQAQMALSDGWGAAQDFRTPGDPPGPIEFFANARLNRAEAGKFSADFDVEILFSDDPDIAAAAATHAAQFAAITGSYATDTVPAPEYTLRTEAPSDIKLDIKTDTNQIVVSVDGSVDLELAPDAQAGQDYVVHGESLVGADYDDVHSAFSNGQGMPEEPVEGYYPIPAASFQCLLGEDLAAATVARTIVIRNSSEGVSTYQTFTIEFTPATN